MRRVLVLLATGMAGALFIIASVRHHPREQPLLSPPAWLLTLADQQARLMGDLHPVSISWVATRREPANQLLGDGVNSNEPVYLVLMKGKFVASHEIVPAQSKPPQGKFSFFVADITSRRLEDYGVGHAPLNLGKLGTVRRLSRNI